MKIIIDSAIPYINGVLEPLSEVIYKKGSEISNEDIIDCDAMIIRTRTKCDKELLHGSNVKFIGTATIGFDHIDMSYCNEQGIAVSTAAGCNAMAVVQYVIAAIVELRKVREIIPENTTIGIIGVGNVGSALEKVLKILGYNVLVNDPPRSKQDKNFVSIPLDILLSKSDIVTLHTPLVKGGDNPTLNMVDSSFLNKMGQNKIIINASRGEVVDEKSLIDAIDNGVISHSVIDVWQNEPKINSDFCDRGYISTPHIAGYSIQGKANGTAIMIKSLTSFFKIRGYEDWYPNNIYIPRRDNDEIFDHIENRISLYYNILDDNNKLKSDKLSFEELRNNYKYRNEFF